jgi:hypothetical protein
MTMASADYSYGDAAPDSALPDTTDYGYGDAAPSTTDYGYGDTTPSTTDYYGYGWDAAPSTTDYGYGDAAPFVVTEKDDGYGDAAPDTDKAADDASKYGYGRDDADAPANNDGSKYEYGDDEPATTTAPAPEKDYHGYGEYTSGYNDENSDHNGNKPKRIQRNKSISELGYESTHSTSASVESYGSYGYGDARPEQPRRQQSYRRRGSVTKYSIESTTEVQQENQDLCQPHKEYTMPADHSYNPERYNAQYNKNNSATELSGEDQFDGHIIADSGEGDDPRKKGKKVNNMIKGLRQMSKRRFSMPADHSYNPERYNAQYSATKLSGEDQFDGHGLADSGEGDDPRKKAKKVKKMMKGLRQMSKRRFSMYFSRP